MGHSRDSYIDMSLDDIINLRQKRQAQGKAERNGRREYASNTNQTYNQISEYNGPQRLRRWFGRQNNYRRTIVNSSKPRAFPSITRWIPLDRDNEASEENGNSESTARQVKNQKSRPERLGRQLTLGPASKSLPSDAASPPEASRPVVFGETLADRTIKQKQQRENKVNQKQGTPPHIVQTSEEKYPSKSIFSGRCQVQMKSRSVLTVCVANSQVGQNKQFKRTNGQTSFQRDKWNFPKTEKKFQPKGISLRYNFRSVANQTKITLNERFSSLKIVKGDFAAPKPGDRTVTLS